MKHIQFEHFIGLGCEFGDLGKIDKEQLNNFHTVGYLASSLAEQSQVN